MLRKTQIVLCFCLLNAFVASYASAQTTTATKLSGGRTLPTAKPASANEFYLGGAIKANSDGTSGYYLAMCIAGKISYLLTAQNEYIPLFPDIWAGRGVYILGNTDVLLSTPNNDNWWQVTPGGTFKCSTGNLLYALLPNSGSYLFMHGGGGNDVLMAPMPYILSGDDGNDTLLSSDPATSTLTSYQFGGSGTDSLYGDGAYCDGGSGASDRCTTGCTAGRVNCEKK